MALAAPLSSHRILEASHSMLPESAAAPAARAGIRQRSRRRRRMQASGTLPRLRHDADAPRFLRRDIHSVKETLTQAAAAGRRDLRRQAAGAGSRRQAVLRRGPAAGNPPPMDTPPVGMQGAQRRQAPASAPPFDIAMSTPCAGQRGATVAGMGQAMGGTRFKGCGCRVTGVFDRPSAVKAAGLGSAAAASKFLAADRRRKRDGRRRELGRR